MLNNLVEKGGNVKTWKNGFIEKQKRTLTKLLLPVWWYSTKLLLLVWWYSTKLLLPVWWYSTKWTSLSSHQCNLFSLGRHDIAEHFSHFLTHLPYFIVKCSLLFFYESIFSSWLWWTLNILNVQSQGLITSCLLSNWGHFTKDLFVYN
jgi:hypothetical protein